MKTSASCVKRVSTDGRVKLLRLPDDLCNALELQVGHYIEVRVSVVRRRLDELISEGTTPEQAEKILAESRPGKKKTAPLQAA